MDNSRVIRRHVLDDASQQIRLLKFDHIGGADRPTPSEDDCFEFHLGVHDLSNINISYIAMSYVWGSDPPSRRISVDGDHVMVGQNCWYALWQMQQHENVRHSYLWIDTLCIDQENVEEKQKQVSRMGEIYNTARMVAACIGPEDGILDFQRCCQNPSQHAKELQYHVNKFLQRQYFQRLWTVQECLLARHTILFCGLYTLDWTKTSENLHECLVSGGVSWPYETSQVVGMFNDAEMYQADDWRRSAGVDLASLVVRYGNRLCSEPRDRLFGLLPMTNSGVRGRLPIDYRLHLRELTYSYASFYDELWVHSRGETYKASSLGATVEDAIDLPSQKIRSSVVLGNLHTMIDSIRILGVVYRLFASRSWRSWRNAKRCTSGKLIDLCMMEIQRCRIIDISFESASRGSKAFPALSKMTLAELPLWPLDEYPVCQLHLEHDHNGGSNQLFALCQIPKDVQSGDELIILLNRSTWYMRYSTGLPSLLLHRCGVNKAIGVAASVLRPKLIYENGQIQDLEWSGIGISVPGEETVVQVTPLDLLLLAAAQT